MGHCLKCSTQARLALLVIVLEVCLIGHAARVAVAIVGDCATNAGDCARAGAAVAVAVRIAAALIAVAVRSLLLSPEPCSISQSSGTRAAAPSIPPAAPRRAPGHAACDAAFSAVSSLRTSMA